MVDHIFLQTKKQQTELFEKSLFDGDKTKVEQEINQTEENSGYGSQSFSGRNASDIESQLNINLEAEPEPQPQSKTSEANYFEQKVEEVKRRYLSDGWSWFVFCWGSFFVTRLLFYLFLWIFFIYTLFSEKNTISKLLKMSEYSEKLEASAAFPYFQDELF